MLRVLIPFGHLEVIHAFASVAAAIAATVVARLPLGRPGQPLVGQLSLGPHSEPVHPQAGQQRDRSMDHVSESGLVGLDRLSRAQHDRRQRTARQQDQLHADHRSCRGLQRQLRHDRLVGNRLDLGHHRQPHQQRVRQGERHLLRPSAVQQRPIPPVGRVSGSCHTLGPDHQDENQTNADLGTCMDYTRNPAGPPNNEHPDAHDFSQLVSIYSRTDSFNTPTFAPELSATAARAIEAPASWGNLVKGSSSHARASMCATPDHGDYTVTFVTWA